MDRYQQTIGTLGVSPTRYPEYLGRLFEGVPLQGRRLLDVGGGSGLISFYAALQGAEVTCLEPTAEGSNPEMDAGFERLRAALGDQAQVELDRRTLQQLDPAPGSYDVIVLHNSVNHLDEDACQALPDDPGARRTFVGLFEELRAALRPGGQVIVADCARLNLFAAVGARNPFVPDIEWHLHQQPKVWAALLEEAGFTRPRIRWNPMTRAGRAGRVLLANWLGAFVTQSHFSLTARSGGAR
ncbi:MAG: class I SAM-dependent methyltransferase [Thermoleophilaceae bacterium]|nr:class I SAM-dependent methyltransferase [Thermoleophilaceae bacterium]